VPQSHHQNHNQSIICQHHFAAAHDSPSMSAKQVEDSIKKLVGMGYSKSKAQKALKECGNNFAQAKLCLERTKEADARKAHEAELAGKAKINAEQAKKEAEERRKRMENEPPQEDIRSQRRHPCIAQYGSCRYGVSCMFKELPWDTCINHVVGNCIYGDHCYNRHAIDGIDIRKIMNPDFDNEHEYVPLPNGNMVQVNRFGGKVQEGEIWEPEYREPVVPAPLPDPSAFTTDEGSVPTYSEPLHHHAHHQMHVPLHHQPLQHTFDPNEDIWGTTNFVPTASDGSSGVVGYTLKPNAVTPAGSPVSAHPTPFLAKALTGKTVQVAPPVVKPITPQTLRQVDVSPAQRTPQQRSHPCVVQMGECRFGDTCNHADMRGDVCVHWLNSRCRNRADQCRYYHEVIPAGGQPSAAAAAAVASAVAGTGATTAAPVNVSPGAGGGSATSMPTTGSFGSRDLSGPPPTNAPAGSGGAAFFSKDSIWSDTPVGTPFGAGAVLGAAAHHQTVRGTRGAATAVDEDAWTRQWDAPSREATAARAGDYVLARMQHDVALKETQPAGPVNTGKWRGPPASLLATSAATSTQPSSPTAAPPQADSNEEARAFETLHEVFPTVDPQIILQALRKCGNDRNLVAQVISESAPENVERALQAATEESFNATKSLALVTLHSLLPSMEPAALEKVLTDSNGDFGEAYRIAASTVEHLVASDVNNRWGDKSTKDAAGYATGYAPADVMKLDRLRGMYRDLEAFVVESAFERAGRVTTDAVAILNHLNSDLKIVTRETREEWGRQATSKPLGMNASSSAAVGSHKKTPPSVPVADPDSFTVTACDDAAAETDAPQGPTALSNLELYRETKTEAADHADWRRTRYEAYMTNTARAQMVTLAINAYARQQHDVGKNLLRKSQELKRRYERLNMLAMHALERERGVQHNNAASVLDLHGFHVNEALDVVARRIELCVRKYVTRLRVIIGHGNHSKTGKSLIYPEVLKQLKAHAAVHVKSILPAEIVVTIEHTH
jgi:DNA-nicking Smr family endonuclease